MISMRLWKHWPSGSRLWLLNRAKGFILNWRAAVISDKSPEPDGLLQNPCLDEIKRTRRGRRTRDVTVDSTRDERRAVHPRR